uniref:Reverse transcriptase domain-containing protein n=1 Tax=Caenorhabditis japonica TaxID=281687 RepID=A0A8R1DIS1_CAEJA
MEKFHQILQHPIDSKVDWDHFHAKMRILAHREVPMSTQDERYSPKIDEDDLLRSDDGEIDEDDAKAFEQEKEVRMNSEMSDSELGNTHLTECVIEVKEEVQPIKQKPRPIPLAIRKTIWEMLQRILDQKVSRKSKSPWASPIVIVKKKDGTVRMCIDYGKVNKVIKNNAHPLPHVESTLQSLSGKKVFSTLDMISSYWQLPLEESSKEVPAFAVGNELYEFNVLPFGLVSSPAVFQSSMEAMLGELLGDCAHVYVQYWP